MVPLVGRKDHVRIELQLHYARVLSSFDIQMRLYLTSPFSISVDIALDSFHFALFAVIISMLTAIIVFAMNMLSCCHLEGSAPYQARRATL